jgi:EVE domain
MQYNWSVAIRYWMGVVQREHVRRAVAMGLAQGNHGSRAAIAQMGEADGIVFYSPKTDIEGEPLKAFTAIGRIADSAVFQAGSGSGSGAGSGAGGGAGSRSGDFRPWRRAADYETDAVEAPIRPLLAVLDFSRDNPNWGYQLRRGMIEISRHDFEVIRQQMRRPSADDRKYDSRKYTGGVH